MKRGQVIGILSIPHKNTYHDSHIIKMYADWLEEYGFKVVLIPYTASPDTYFYHINGLFIPGGDDNDYILKNKTFIKNITRYFELSIQPGEYFPIWGTCFGFQMLLFILGDFNKLHEYHSHDFYPITIIKPNSRLFSAFPKKQLNIPHITFNNHHLGISPSDFMKNTHLHRGYDIVATSYDMKGRIYVSAFEGKHHPIYGVQWHPERQTNSQPFLAFLNNELAKNKHKIKKLIRKTRKALPCKQYKEQKHSLCYFF